MFLHFSGSLYGIELHYVLEMQVLKAAKGQLQ